MRTVFRNAGKLIRERRVDTLAFAGEADKIGSLSGVWTGGVTRWLGVADPQPVDALVSGLPG